MRDDADDTGRDQADSADRLADDDVGAAIADDDRDHHDRANCNRGA